MRKITWEELEHLPIESVVCVRIPEAIAAELDVKDQPPVCRTYYFVWGGTLEHEDEMTSTQAHIYLSYLHPELTLSIQDDSCHGLKFHNRFGSIRSQLGETVHIRDFGSMWDNAEFAVLELSDLAHLIHTCADLFIGYDHLQERGIKDVQRKYGRPFFGPEP